MYKQASKNWMVAYWHWTSKWTDIVGTHGRHLLGWAIVGWKMGKSRKWKHNKKLGPKEERSRNYRSQEVRTIITILLGWSID